jgi:hypothetical protein
MTREEAIELLKTTPIDIRSPRDDLEWRDYFGALDMAIEALQERPKGRWIYNDGYNTCSVCHNEVAEYGDCGRRQDFILCPNCGADMRDNEEQDV